MFKAWAMCKCKWMSLSLIGVLSLIFGLAPTAMSPMMWETSNAIGIWGVWLMLKVMAILFPIFLYLMLWQLWRQLFHFLRYAPCPIREEAGDKGEC